MVSIFSQSCLPSGLYITSQQQIDDFTTNNPGCTQVTGYVFISGNSITDLNGLSTITSIGGNLIINNCDQLTHINGLSSLLTVGGNLEIKLNDNLLDIDGLSALTSIGGFITLDGNPALNNLDGFSSLSSLTGGLSIWNNASIINVNGLSNLTSTSGISLSNNSNLANIGGLSALTTINGSIFIATQPMLSNLDGLSQVTTIDGYLRISDNILLDDITGIENIDATGFHKVNWCGCDDVEIHGNSILSVCDVQSVCNFIGIANADPAKSTEIHSNLPNCNSESEVEASCGTVSCPGSITFTNQQEVDDFPSNYPGCTEIIGDMTIEASTIANLDSLNSIVTITGNVKIKNNPNLLNVSGLRNLTTVGKFELIDNTNLSSLILSNLTTTDYFLVYNNDQLTNLDSLTSLTTINGTAGYGYTAYIKPGLEISENATLTNIEGLSSLSTINGYINIQSNILLTSLDGLENVISIDGFLFLYNNHVLNSIDGLTNLDPSTIVNASAFSTDADLAISQNYALSLCDVSWLCDYLDISGNVTGITTNATNCNSIAEVQIQCDILTPYCTMLSYPLDSDVEVDENADLEWLPAYDATAYLLRVGTFPGGTDIVNNVNVGNVTFYDIGTMPYNTDIYVMITPINQYGNAIGCIEESFKTFANLPSCTNLTSPINGQSDIDVNSHLSWDASTNVTGYKLLVWESGGDTILNHLDVGNVLTYDPGLLPLVQTIKVKIIPYNNTGGERTDCPTEYFNTNNGILFSGSIQYPNGNKSGGRIIIFDPNTYEVIKSGTQQDFEIYLIPGVYNVYYRPIASGAQSYEIRNLDLTSSLDTVLLLSPYTSPDYFSEISWSQCFMYGEGQDSVTIQAEVNPGYNIDSVFWFKETSSLNPSLPIDIAKVLMLDDGNEKDLIANDGIYTSASLIQKPGTNYSRSNALSSSRLAFLQVFEGNNATHYKSSTSQNIGIANPNATTITPFTDWSDSVKINNHLINIVSSSFANSFITPPHDVAALIYSIYPDSFDFVNILYVDELSAVNLHWDVSNNISGIGESTFDFSNSFGSNGRLKGINTFSAVRVSQPTHHETMHQWGNSMSMFNGGNYGSHNGYSSIFGLLGGMLNPSIINSTTITSYVNIPYGLSSDKYEFADIELYMMGVLDTMDLRDEYIITSVDTWDTPVLIGSGSSGEPDTFQVSYVLTKTPQDMVSQHGYRSPAPTDTVTIFKTAYVVISSKPLSEAGNMFYTYLAKVWEGSQAQPAPYISFDEATQFRADMITKLPSPKCDPILTLNGTIPTGTYQAGIKIILNGIPANNSIINLDAPKVDVQLFNTTGTSTILKILTPTGCGN